MPAPHILPPDDEAVPTASADNHDVEARHSVKTAAPDIEHVYGESQVDPRISEYGVEELRLTRMLSQSKTIRETGAHAKSTLPSSLCATLQWQLQCLQI